MHPDMHPQRNSPVYGLRLVSQCGTSGRRQRPDASEVSESGYERAKIYYCQVRGSGHSYQRELLN